ncbi:kelch domain-containing protein 2-like isoform X1 [Biomphalaria glabrata]|uniref:Kelch domain-containing protein 2-like isoform X1 n=2 Tax=Biomphalaria glabrata TaxID=6526 RepID=A0A9W2ZZV2_BIOGL|nr:kelch domain-containing protein 2-like isoform X1 [Biomphalaria glabrata]XP_055880474.1 kelch domain-containing protein 2-like isoform X1 [Biomphalaria glabrata]XP_055880475.1 kelch domain-containing protein 2-like isoform X1 [Biomphalaria glabrata]XP_055880476.1 kelch domain-containing protein 2-like isoform X1 [Biomphalaria glabrata]XP_055880477.1 kelch domain-containing protein 2-like isoform X1 [Biomphalaria glabrata]XP_055880478.1 kelch domain-containing protein 2-like isoform X1 [Biom
MALQLKSLRSLKTWQSAHEQDVFFCPERCGHNAVCINDELLIWGGYNDTPNLGSTYCEKDLLWNYNLDMDIWTCVKTRGLIPKNRSGAISALIWPFWYILCGHVFEGDTNDIHRLNLVTLVWEKLNPSGLLISPRDKASSWVYRNRIYCFGGFGSRPTNCLWNEEYDKYTLEMLNNRGWNDQLLYFDAEKLEWVLVQCKGNKPKGRAAHSTVCVDSTVYLFGGRHQTQRMNDLHCLNLESQTWSGSKYCRGNLPIERSWHSMTAINKSELIMYGGFSNDNVPLDDLWLLDVQSFTWTLLVHGTGQPRLWHSASLNMYGDILIYGGCCSNILEDTERLITSDQVIVLRRTPFTLERLCLHAVYKNKKVTKEGWDTLPRLLKEWLHLKLQITNHMFAYKSNAISLLGPNVTQLTVLTVDEAEQLNKEELL